MNIWFKDIKKNLLFEIEEENEEEFCDNYEEPRNLINLDVVYCDGGGFNGTFSKAAFGEDLGKMGLLTTPKDMTNNEMEYIGLINAMLISKPETLILSDSKLIVNQVNQKWKCNHEHLMGLRGTAITLKHAKKLELEWIPREKNLAGIKLEKIKLEKVKK